MSIREFDSLPNFLNFYKIEKHKNSIIKVVPIAILYDYSTRSFKLSASIFGDIKK